ncbi:uncharacterized protein LOC119726393 [Patiria miniata]|uniref:Uncharacterized protein n=1 Tax=Patiria miniata TaxID=46514 RepID=A0A913ZS23_PATMI|nr:uncharacterized protein LOC119726393 [Patiria miniata]
MRFDEVLTCVGELGLYQFRVALFITIMWAPLMWYPNVEIFTNPSVNHWCSVPEIRDQCGAWGLDEAQCDQKIIDVAVPTLSGKGNDNCRRYNWTGVEVGSLWVPRPSCFICSHLTES